MAFPGFPEIFDQIVTEAPYKGTYSLALVTVSVCIAVLASFVALSIASRMARATSTRARLYWAVAGAFGMGVGIWSMHFIGMMAFEVPCGLSYDPIGTLLSMIPGILASGVALEVISRVRNPAPGRLFAGSVLMGGGIGAMHYAGMAAIWTTAYVRYQPLIVALSVVVAVVLALVAFEARFTLRRFNVSEAWSTLIAACVMGVAISGMHYTAMQAVIFYPGDNGVFSNALLPTALLAIFVTLGATLMAGLTYAASIAGQRSELAAGLEIEIARRRALEYEAESGRARLEAIVDSVVDAIVTIDVHGRILQWSSAAQRIFGYAPEEVLGAPVTMLMPEPHRTAHAGYVTAFMKTRVPKIIGIGGRELTAVRKDGTEFPIELAISEVRNGSETFFTGILRDITERKAFEAELVRAREDAEAANQAKSQFLATMSHEIRTPMNGVLGMANLLATTPLSERQTRLVENVARSGQALLGIINDILDFAKIEAGKFELLAIPFDPRETIAELTDLFSERCTAKGLEFVYFVAEDVPAQLIGDPIRLRQILVNLVGNAIKFTERGEILVEVSMLSKNNDGVVLNFSVEDTGIGIPAEQVARIFESFHQVDASMTRSRGGSGLGLSITRQLVELMNGKVSVESELGRGSRFAFTARLQAVPAGTEVARGPRHLARPVRALLADANAVSSHVLSLYLTTWQVDTDVVSTVDEARAALQVAAEAGAAYDVAILDVKGLGAPIVEFAREFRTAANGRRTEAILLVGIDSYMADTTLDELGAIAVLPKPVRPSELFNALVSAATEGDQRDLVPYALRRKTLDIPTFSARVMVAEDNAVNQEVASGILETMGCRVVTVPNGRAAFQLVAQEKFDLILMDCEMPIMDGLEATRRIRQIETMEQANPGSIHTLRTPIIALTAHAMTDVRAQCIEAGMDDFLVKPFGSRELGDILSRWLTPIGTVAPIPKATEEVALDEAIIDESVVASLRALDRGNGNSPFDKAMARFAEIGPALAASMGASCERGDVETLWRDAHSLKSSAGALGARLLSQRCAEIETKARDIGVDEVRPLVLSIKADVEAAIQRLQR